MAKGIGPILLLGGGLALLMATKKKPTENGLPEPPGPEPMPEPEPEPGPEPEPPGPIEVELPGSLLPPGGYSILAGREYLLPLPVGIVGDIDVFILGMPGETPVEAIYGPNSDYVWEKEKSKDHAILQFQKPGMYDVRLWEEPDQMFSDYNFRVIEA